jgi:hypothetical protein
MGLSTATTVACRNGNSVTGPDYEFASQSKLSGRACPGLPFFFGLISQSQLAKDATLRYPELCTIPLHSYFHINFRPECNFGLK